jgi:hypothetical protein
MEAMRDPESQALRPMLASEIGRALDELRKITARGGSF